MDNLPKLNLKTLIEAFFESKMPTLSELLEGFNLTTTSKYLYGFSYGREALLALFKLKKWQRIALPTFTCPIIYEAIVKSGATPVFIDIDEKTFTLDLKSPNLEANFDAIVVVHTFGNIVDVPKLKNRLPKHVKIIEDLAHALDKNVGNTGDYALVSLYKQVDNLNGSILVSTDKLAVTYPTSPKHDYFKYLLFLTQLRPLVNFVRKFTQLPTATTDLGEISPLSAMSKKLFQKNKNTIHPVFSENKLVDNRDAELINLRQKGIFADRQWSNSVAPNKTIGKAVSDKIINLPWSR